jgi:hypothetical protein
LDEFLFVHMADLGESSLTGNSVGSILVLLFVGWEGTRDREFVVIVDVEFAYRLEARTSSIL